MIETDQQFYSNLPIFELSVNQLMAAPENFSEVPASWYVISTDIKNSTQAIAQGKHQVINLVATGCIIASMNLAAKAGINIPFFFGGDGASLIVPQTLLKQTMSALAKHQDNAKESFGLELRVGQLSVAKIYHQNQQLRIAKLKRCEELDVPVVMGNGLQYAERLLKEESQVQETTDETALLDLSGMECRWDQVSPPNDTFEVVSLLVLVRSTDKQARTFKQVLDKIDEIYGSPKHRNPISEQKLKLKASPARLGLETKVKFGTTSFKYLIANWLRTLIGKPYIKYHQDGRYYAKKLVEMSDTLVLDGKINTVISGTVEQRKQLVQFLDEMEQRGDIEFGWFASKSSIMSCYVRDRQDRHIHFVDGADGGYTKAAGMLKSKS